jgi:hypothetical protein
MDEEGVRPDLTREEALVLFELLRRFCDTDRLMIEDQAEKVALWGLLNALERELVEPLASNYDQLLRQARDRLRDSSE